MRNCQNCKDPVHVADFRTGLIHVETNKYVCDTPDKASRRATVAE